MLRRLVKINRARPTPSTHRHKRHCHACTCCYACLEKSEHSGEHDLSWSFGGCTLGCLMFQSQPRQKNTLTAQSSKTHQGPASLPRARRHDNACEHTYADHCACHPRLVLSHAHTEPQNHHKTRQTSELLRLCHNQKCRLACLHVADIDLTCKTEAASGGKSSEIQSKAEAQRRA